MKKTPLYENHLRLGGKITDFGGWALPVQYEGIIPEHKVARKTAGLFDVSHMGEIKVTGPQAQAFLNRILTNDISATPDSSMIYSPMCYPDGGTVDDVMVYKLGQKDFLLVVNASNINKDFEWIAENNFEGADISNVSADYAQIAIQGPEAEKILQKLTDTALSGIRFMRFMPQVTIAAIPALVSRSGYTGEDGFEIYIKVNKAVQMWEAILAAGGEYGLKPAGLGARDTLRLEAALPLYGHELTKEITPLEAGLKRFVKLGKEEFIGKESLEKQAEEEMYRALVGFELTERGVPRNGFEVSAHGQKIGFVTSGSYSPSLDKTIGMALIERPYASEGNGFDITIRGKEVGAAVVKMPFYSKKYKKL